MVRGGRNHPRRNSKRDCIVGHVTSDYRVRPDTYTRPELERTENAGPAAGEEIVADPGSATVRLSADRHSKEDHRVGPDDHSVANHDPATRMGKGQPRADSRCGRKLCAKKTPQVKEIGNPPNVIQRSVLPCGVDVLAEAKNQQSKLLCLAAVCLPRPIRGKHGSQSSEIARGTDHFLPGEGYSDADL